MPEGPCEGGKCAYGSIYCGYPPCGGCCGCLGGCVVEYEEVLERLHPKDSDKCPECTRSFGHKMDCSRGR